MRTLVVGALIVLAGLAWLGSRPGPAPAGPIDLDAIDRAAAKRAAVRVEKAEERRKLSERVEPALARLAGDGVTREDLKAHLEPEIVSDLDVDDLCNERERE